MILIIDNYDSFTHNLYQCVATYHDEVIVKRHDKISVEEVAQLNPDGIILSPGPGRPEHAGICVDLIKNLKPSTALLGVCLGHQAIAYAFGANIIPANEIMHGKSDAIFHHRQGIYAHLPLPFEAGRYHSLIVERASLPSSLLIEAENAQGVIMGIRHRTLPIYGVQFHPESILTPVGNQLLQKFVQHSLRQVLVS